MKVEYWFRVNKKGLGWTPQTWQGYVVTVLYLVALGYSYLKANEASHAASDTFMVFILNFLIFTALLVIITYLKGEPIAFGSKDEEQPKAP